MGLSPLIGEAVGAVEQHGQAATHFPVHHVGDCKRALHQGRKLITRNYVFPVSWRTASSCFRVISPVKAFQVLEGVALALIVGVFRALTPFLLSATAKLFLVSHYHQFPALVSEFLSNYFNDGSAAGEGASLLDEVLAENGGRIAGRRERWAGASRWSRPRTRNVCR